MEELESRQVGSGLALGGLRVGASFGSSTEGGRAQS